MIPKILTQINNIGNESNNNIPRLELILNIKIKEPIIIIGDLIAIINPLRIAFETLKVSLVILVSNEPVAKDSNFSKSKNNVFSKILFPRFVEILKLNLMLNMIEKKLTIIDNKANPNIVALDK